MRVLLAEDEPDLASALQRSLQEEGLACDLVYRGDDALDRVATWPYDIVVLDLMLPGLPGPEVLVRLRRTHRVPVLIITAQAAVQERVRLLDLGADDYLIKPFALDELLARVRALVRRSAGVAAARLQLGGITIDSARREVWKDGLAVKLSPREYAVFHHLVLQRGRVVSQAALFEHVHDENDEASSNVIEVYISQLRKKLGAEVVRTRRGEGYVIDE